MYKRKNDIKFHEELKQASIAVYGKKGSYMPNGYIRKCNPVENKSNGFYAEVWQKGNDIVIVYRGTEITSKQDINNDLSMAHSILPKQAIDALALHDKIKRENPNCRISLAGHSLGGSLAQIVGALRGTFAVTFNAYGTKNMFQDSWRLKYDNIVNYLNEFDPITMINAENHVGDNYLLSNVNKNHMTAHFIENMQSLDKRTSQTTDELKSRAEQLHGRWLNLRRTKRIFERNRNDVLEKSYHVLQLAANKIGDFKQDVSEKFKHLSENYSQCVGSYPVSSYTRSDGTEVRGYTRICGAKHGN